MLKAVIFDMDGLMVDTEVISFQCYKDIIESYHFPFTLDEYIQSYPGRPLHTSIQFIKEHYQLDFQVEEKIQLFKSLEEKYMKKDGVQLKKGYCHYFNIFKIIIFKLLLRLQVFVSELIKF